MEKDESLVSGYTEEEKKQLKENYKGHCINCKCINQGRDKVQCFNPKQTNQSLINRVWWNMSCLLSEDGNQLTSPEMEALGFERKKEGTDYPYYEKKRNNSINNKIK